MRMRSVMMFGLGYLFGTKAGRERYQELTQSLKQMASSDVTRQAMEKARTSMGLGAATGEGGDSTPSSSTGGGGQDTSSGDQEEQDRPEGWEHAEGGAWVPQDEQAQSGDDQQRENAS